MAGLNGMMSIAGNRFEDYKCDANDAITFKLVRTEADLEDASLEFHPDMSHQLFGDSESIFGYKDLKVNIYCTAARMNTYVGITSSDRISPSQADGVGPDNILKVLNAHLQPGFETSLDQFQKKLQLDAKFKPFGELIHSYSVEKDGKERQFEIYKASMSEVGFKDWHERIQPYLMFYVDAASYIDVDDDRWDYYLIFEKYKYNGNPMCAFVGYMTVYSYYAYPALIRPRVSQVLVLPPFQRMGHGAVLLQTFYNECERRKDVLDITVEDPSENFQRVRDFVDAKNCSKLECFQPFVIKQGFSDTMIKEAREKLKLNRKQTRRMYEILRLKATDPSVEFDYREYRIDIKKRLNIPFQKNGRDFAKLRRALNPNELNAALNMSSEQRKEYLDKTFADTVDEYRRILERLAIS